MNNMPQFSPQILIQNMNPQIGQIFQMLQGSQNPMALMQQMFGNNPNFQQVMKIAQGKSPQELEQYTRNLFKGQNVDLNAFARQLGINL